MFPSDTIEIRGVASSTGVPSFDNSDLIVTSTDITVLNISLEGGNNTQGAIYCGNPNGTGTRLLAIREGELNAGANQYNASVLFSYCRDKLYTYEGTEGVGTYNYIIDYVNRDYRMGNNIEQFGFLLLGLLLFLGVGFLFYKIIRK